MSKDYTPGLAPDQLAARIKIRRKAAGLTQAQLAARMGVTQSVIGDYESGRLSPNLTRLVQLDRILNGGLVSPVRDTLPARKPGSDPLRDLLLKRINYKLDFIEDPEHGERYIILIDKERNLKYELSAADFDALQRFADTSAEFFEFELNKLLQKIGIRNYGKEN